MTFADIIGRLQGGEAFTRRAWDGSKFIVCQNPQTIPADVVPKMTSLPERAKELLAASFVALFPIMTKYWLLRSRQVRLRIIYLLGKRFLPMTGTPANNYSNETYL